MQSISEYKDQQDISIIYSSISIEKKPAMNQDIYEANEANLILKAMILKVMILKVIFLLLKVIIKVIFRIIMIYLLSHLLNRLISKMVMNKLYLKDLQQGFRNGERIFNIKQKMFTWLTRVQLIIYYYHYGQSQP